MDDSKDVDDLKSGSTSDHDVNDPPAASVSIASLAQHSDQNDHSTTDDQTLRKKIVFHTTVVLVIELLVIELLHTIIWVTGNNSFNSETSIDSYLHNSHTNCNINAMNQYKTQKEDTYQLLHIGLVFIRILYLVQAQKCQWKFNDTRDKSSQKKCSQLMTCLGLINETWVCVLIIYMLMNAAIKDASDNGFGKSGDYTVGFYKLKPLCWLWIIDMVIFAGAWVSGHYGDMAGEECFDKHSSRQDNNVKPSTNRVRACVMSESLCCFFVAISLLILQESEHSSLDSSDRFISFQLQLDNNIDIDIDNKISQINNTISCIYEHLNIGYNYTTSIDGHNEYIQYSCEINGDTSVTINGDGYTDLVSILNSNKTAEINGSDDTFTAWKNTSLYETCLPFHVNEKNYAGVRYKGARFDDIVVGGSHEYQFYQIYLFCQYSNAITEFVECSIHKVEREDVIMATFYVNFLSCTTFSNITAAVEFSTTNYTLFQNLLFTVCFDEFVVN